MNDPRNKSCSRSGRLVICLMFGWKASKAPSDQNGRPVEALMTKSHHRTCFFSVVVAMVGFTLAYSVLVAGMPLAGQTAKPAPSAYEKLLTVADVASVTNIKGLKRVPAGSVEGAAGDLNVIQSDGSPLLMVSFGDASLFKAWKVQDDFNSAVEDIGDEAFNAPKVKAPYVLCVRKGNRALALSSFLSLDTAKPLLSQDQLRSLAKIILSRL
jgi:hypothetical protein